MEYLKKNKVINGVTYYSSDVINSGHIYTQGEEKGHPILYVDVVAVKGDTAISMRFYEDNVEKALTHAECSIVWEEEMNERSHQREQIEIEIYEDEEKNQK